MVTAIVPTVTLVVNPAFLQEIKDSNPDLTQTVLELRRVLQSDETPAQIARRLARLLDDLRDHLALQFALEESYGYIAVPKEPSGSADELAQRLQSQHGRLYMQLSDLAEQAEELQYRGVEPNQLHLLLQQTVQFDRDLRDHEYAEHELIERSFDVP